ncbi:shikimate kinase [Gillisia sp. Hel1_33_143]|uniref:shikimate kinase n=1 Tax=Gillisia sp. Hel1_33_143 TaxID=1336796 RepID=UPI00087A2211|nr:shikimate kinase [Gillisia sp. Hel1_33_143]SDR66029.1 shikimate kinase [Gillisia sp. Hel1_33_143]
MKIFLSGYMGSGKSLIADYISQKMRLPLVDLDDQITLIEELTVSEIFATKGELYFRKLETKVLEDVLEEPIDMIVALGGGTPCYGINMDLIKSHTEANLVYLKASVDFLTNRLFQEKETRPVISHLATKDLLEDFIRKHLFERSYYYNQADIVVNVENRKADEIGYEIIQKLK